jgi:tetratricopeptide (TPR) repeat protein
MVRFCSLTGRTQEAEEWADRAGKIKPTSPADHLAIIESAAFVDNHKLVLKLVQSFEGYELPWTTSIGGTAAVFAGTACAKTGDIDSAFDWWDRASGEADAEGTRRREELERPESDRNEPWYFNLRGLLPARVTETFFQLVKSPEALGEFHAWVPELLDIYPEMKEIAPYLLRSGDDEGRFFALAILESLNSKEHLPLVVKLLTESRLRADRAQQAFRLLQRHGTVTMPVSEPGAPALKKEKAPETLRVNEYEISLEPTGDLPPEVQGLSDEAYELLYDDRPEEAEKLLRQALDIRDDIPSLRQNLAAAYEKQGKAEAAMQIIEQTHHQFPDYAFARCGEALRRFRLGGEVEDSLALLEPLMEQKRFHITEFSSLCHAMCTLLVGSERLDAAASWLDMWIKANPEDRRVKDFTALAAYSAMQELFPGVREPGE